MKEFSLVNNWWQLVVIGVICYLFGCINFGWIIARAMKKDITKMGSGNPGTMNVTRELGIKAGVATFLGDALKGVIPMLVCYFLYRDFRFENSLVSVADFMRYFTAVCVVVGHIFPLSIRHRGGKGIASTLGIFWCGLSLENPWWILGGVGVGVIIIGFIILTQWGSLGSLMGVSGCTVVQAVIFFNRYANYPIFKVDAYTVCLFMFLLALIILTWWAHRKNLQRLFAGEEHRTSFIKKHKKP
jgi:glycerol-3-phosphate acyltransferase PlsY